MRVAPLLAALLLPAAAFAQAPPSDAAKPTLAASPRADIENFGALLDAAVRRVSRPGGLPLLGSGGCRGYRIAGVGAVFVLAPRALPPRQFVVRRLVPPGITLPSPGEEATAAVAGESVAPPARPHPHRMRPDERERALRAIEAQALAFQRDAARARLAAEQALAEAELEFQRRLAAGVPAPSPAPAAPAPTALAAPAAPAAAEPATPPRAPAAAEAPPPPPWSSWFGAADEPDDERTPDAIVADVRTALTATLEAKGAQLRVVAPEELLVTAVDFVPDDLFPGAERPGRTLVVRVRKRDLDERSAGRISSDELRKRIEAVEY